MELLFIYITVSVAVSSFLNFFQSVNADFQSGVPSPHGEESNNFVSSLIPNSGFKGPASLLASRIEENCKCNLIIPYD